MQNQIRKQMMLDADADYNPNQGTEHAVIFNADGTPYSASPSAGVMKFVIDADTGNIVPSPSTGANVLTGCKLANTSATTTEAPYMDGGDVLSFDGDNITVLQDCLLDSTVRIEANLSVDPAAAMILCYLSTVERVADYGEPWGPSYTAFDNQAPPDSPGMFASTNNLPKLASMKGDVLALIVWPYMDPAETLDIYNLVVDLTAISVNWGPYVPSTA